MAINAPDDAGRGQGARKMAPTRIWHHFEVP
jgi:hypothetical protein